MPIQFTCTGCSKTFNAPDSAAGKQVKCPSCSTVNLVPAGGVAAAPAPPPPMPQGYGDPAGAPQVHYHMGGPGGVPAGPSMAMAITGMVLGIVGFVIALFPCVGWLGLILGILGAVFSSIGLAQAMKTKTGKGMAVTGLSLSLLAILVWPIYLIIFFVMFASAANDLNNQLKNNPPNIQITTPPVPNPPGH